MYVASRRHNNMADSQYARGKKLNRVKKKKRKDFMDRHHLEEKKKDRNCLAKMHA